MLELKIGGYVRIHVDVHLVPHWLYAKRILEYLCKAKKPNKEKVQGCYNLLMIGETLNFLQTMLVPLKLIQRIM